MNDSPIPLGEQPATVIEAAASEQPQTADAYEALNSLDSSGLIAALGFVPEDSEQQEPPSTPPDQPPASEQPAPVVIPEEDAKTVSRRRLSVTALSEEDRQLNAAAVEMVAKGEAANLIEAVMALRGDAGSTPPADPNPEPEHSPIDPEPASSSTDLKSQLTDLRAQRAEAKRNFDMDEEIRLTDEIEDLQLTMVRAEQAERGKQAEVSSYQADYKKAVDEMESTYSALLNDEDSPFADLLEDKVEAARSRKDPSLADPRHILEMAAAVAKVLSAGKPQRAPVPPNRPPVVGGAVAPSHAPTQQITRTQAQEFIETATAEQLAAALF